MVSSVDGVLVVAGTSALAHLHLSCDCDCSCKQLHLNSAADEALVVIFGLQES